VPELWTLLRVVLSLAIVLALAVLALRFGLPRLMGMGALGGGRTRRLEVLESAPLDRQHRVALVRVAGREYLLGVGAAQVTALDSWPAPEAAGGVAEATGTPALPANSSSGAVPPAGGRDVVPPALRVERRARS
jgi:flagellar biosynthetic protein FliO